MLPVLTLPAREFTHNLALRTLRKFLPDCRSPQWSRQARDRMRARCQACVRRARTMKAGRFLRIFPVAILIVFSGVVQAQDNKPAAEYSLGADRIARMEQIIDSFANAKQFMGEVLVAEDGRAVLRLRQRGVAGAEYRGIE